METPDYVDWFSNQVIFITGATGSLGACLLYKLSVKLSTRKIFVLSRRSREKSLQTWKRTIPQQLDQVLDTNKLQFVMGDVTKPNLGLSSSDVALLISEVTVVLHAAGNINLANEAYDAVIANTLPALEMTKMAENLPKLTRFVILSSAYVNAFLPDGPVFERLYETKGQMADPFAELDLVMAREKLPVMDEFPWGYAYAKHLMERLLLWDPRRKFPILFIRPTLIGPAINQPYPLYGPDQSIPLNTLARLYAQSGGGTRVWYSPTGRDAGSNIIDEIPVDLVSNILLLHMVEGSTGIVHAGAQLYNCRSARDFTELLRSNLSPSSQSDFPHFAFTHDRSIPQCALADFYHIGSRDWNFDCSRSERWRHTDGPLSLSLINEGPFILIR
ncbi:uncharacterized protein N7529_007212 [Penicillium soppii]|uniref:uncharacterized protein n=1 Tax=Penicillium soppii TaxID=69789 RepID=UPI0025473821|nr:uncharacterized protein N7529_007212 [Penicillium soppii]KAJ5865296.1 hypothetical protein N7529_007212 [Penicillium soppii]